jgi:hypothetical protein
VSVDGETGLQAFANTARDLPPVPGRHASLGRDHEYRRLGTCSILTAMTCATDMSPTGWNDGIKSVELTALHNDLDAHLRLILDNRSHFRETQDYLATRPNRFKYVPIP